MALYISGVLIGMSLVLELGTGNLALIRTGITKGFLPAFIFSIGCAVGDMVYAVLSVLGIALLLQSSSIFQNILWIGGTIMLCYLTYQAIKDFFSPKQITLEGKDVAKRSLWAYFFTGIWLVVSAPTALVWFATVGGSVVSSTIGNSSVDQSLVPFFFGFVTVSIVWGAFLAYLSSIGGKLMGAKMLRVFSLASGLLFLYFSFYVFISGLKNVMSLF
ncbi:LysE family translocator [Brevibacillus fluminis]|nr:LysE family transporter [Brevibacillus fluminis]